MKKIFVALCVAVCAVCPLKAQDSTPANAAPSVQEVMDFFDVMDIRTQMQTMLEAEQKQLKLSFGDMFGKMLPDATPKEREQFQAIMESTMNDLFSNYPVEEILRDMVPIYQKHLTESDLKAVIAFYSSPAGKKILHEMPAMTAEAMRVSFTRMQPKIEEVMKKMQSRIAAMAAADRESKGKSGTSAAPKSPTTNQ